MLNQFILQTAGISAAAYNNADSIVLLLCKECVPGISKLHLPSAVERAVQAYIAAHEDIYGAGETNTIVLRNGEQLLTVVLAGCGSGRE